MARETQGAQQVADDQLPARAESKRRMDIHTLTQKSERAVGRQ